MLSYYALHVIKCHTLVAGSTVGLFTPMSSQTHVNRFHCKVVAWYQVIGMPIAILLGHFHICSLSLIKSFTPMSLSLSLISDFHWFSLQGR